MIGSPAAVPYPSGRALIRLGAGLGAGVLGLTVLAGCGGGGGGRRIRRRIEDFLEHQQQNLTTLAAVRSGEQITATPELSNALETLRAEWQQTYDDLAAVPTDELTPGRTGTAAAWRSNLQLAEDRVAAFTTRIDAVATGDPARMTEAWTGGPGTPGWDWEPLGLDRRDCRSIDA